MALSFDSGKDRVVAIGIAAAVAALIVLGFFAQATWFESKQAQAALAAADKEVADRIRKESTAAREAASPELTGRNDQRIQAAVARLASRSPMIQCDAALELGRLGATDQIPALQALLANEPAGNARNCAAGALVRLGDVKTALAAYIEWADGTHPDLHRAGIMGFGDIGESAVDVALPYLTEELKSPHADARYIAVETLSKLGPAAVPLLEVAAGDIDKLVHDRARTILATRR